jgi:hypothetical protein
MATTPIIAPNETVADVPNEHVDALLRKGGKIGVDMLSPDGREQATVPLEQAQDLLKRGARFAPPPGTPGMPKPPNAIRQDIAKSQAATQSAGPFTQPGAAEEAIGRGGSPIDYVKAPAMGANFAAATLTGGASLPVQSAIQGGAAALDTAAQGGTARQIATQGAIGAAIPPFAAGLSYGAQKLAGLLTGSAMKQAGGKLFQVVDQAAANANLTVDTSKPGEAALAILENKQKAGQLPQGIR